MNRMITNRQRYQHTAWSILATYLLWLACENLPALTPNFIPAADFDEQESILVCWNWKHRQTLLPLIATIAVHDHVTVFYNEKNHYWGQYSGGVAICRRQYGTYYPYAF